MSRVNLVELPKQETLSILKEYFALNWKQRDKIWKETCLKLKSIGFYELPYHERDELVQESKKISNHQNK